MGACVSSQSNDHTTKQLSETVTDTSSQCNDNSTMKFSRTVTESETELIAAIVIKISKDVSSMAKMVKLLGTSEDTEELRTQLDRIDDNIDQLIIDAGDRIRKLGLNEAQNLGLPKNLLNKIDHLLKSLRRYDAEKEALKKIIEELKMALRLKEDLTAIEARNKENLERLKDKVTPPADSK